MKRKFSFVCFVSLFSFGMTWAQSEKPMYEIHVAMIYNFTKYVQWPDNGSSEFVIGILGEDNVYKTMKNFYEGKPKGSKKYVIKKLNDVSEAALCAVVYIGKNRSKDFDDLKSAIADKPVLTITDSFNLGRRGSCINFKVIDEKLKFEINQASINGASLKVASQLTSMAIMI